MAENKSYVTTDEHGVMRVANTRVMLDSIVVAFEQGHSPETIRDQYPSLTLEQVYGAITYYLANRDDVLDYLKRQVAVWAEWEGWSRSRPSPLLERLRARRETLSRTYDIR